MSNEPNDQLERRIRFVAKHYKEGALDADKAWKQLATNRKITRTLPFRRYLAGAAAAVLVLIGVGALFIVEKKTPDWVAVTTAGGQVKDVYLPDSTLISLAENSSVRYNAKVYGKERRVVEMNGKAFFQVKQDEARPFSVHTALTKVTVLGTSFQVNEQSTSTEVNVMTGKVCFAAGNENDKVILTAGMSAQYSIDKKEIIMLTEEETNVLSWRTGQLRFNNTPLDKVITDLNTYYQIKIVNRTKTTDAKLTATFNQLPLDEVLMVINQTLDVRLTPDVER